MRSVVRKCTAAVLRNNRTNNLYRNRNFGLTLTVYLAGLQIAVMTSSSEAAEPDAGQMVNLLDLAASALASTVSASLIIQDKCRSVSFKSIASALTDCEGSEHFANSFGHDGKNARLKEDGSFVTDADFAAQGIIVQSLRQISEDIQIVGEESPEEMAQHIGKHEPLFDRERIYNLARHELYQRFCQSSTTDAVEPDHRFPLSFRTSPVETHKYSEKQKDSLPTLPESRQSEYLVHPSRVAVFVDPLDGTKSYAHGQYESVSVLIGIIVDHKPAFGVICKPFGCEGITSILHTDCAAVYGGTLLNDVYVAGNQSCRSGIGAQTSDSSSSSLYCAVISASRSKGIVEDFCTYLGSIGLIHPKPLLISGAGVKSLCLILRQNNEGLWFYPKGGTYLWDVAASDALLRTLGGKLTDKFGEDLDYSKSRAEAQNSKGVIACIDSQLHADCIRIYHEKDWEPK